MKGFTRYETDILYNLVRDEHDKVMCGDWDAVKGEIAELHLIMHKLLVMQREAR